MGFCNFASCSCGSEEQIMDYLTNHCTKQQPQKDWKNYNFCWMSFYFFILFYFFSRFSLCFHVFFPLFFSFKKMQPRGLCNRNGCNSGLLHLLVIACFLLFCYEFINAYYLSDNKTFEMNRQ